VTTIFFGILGGVIPAIFWLWFWLREDRKRPEPRGLLFLSFIMGMIAVPLVIPLQKMVMPESGAITLGIIILWAFFEEILKYLGSFVVALRSRAMDEPIDAMIYLITTALGFAALENTLFLVNSLSQGELLNSLITGNMRFIGATLLHTISSGVVGLSIALNFYNKRFSKKVSLVIGLILATTLHTIFNFFIMNATSNGIFWVFLGVWILVILLILFFERVKNIRRNKNA
jgi:protease PrsW